MLKTGPIFFLLFFPQFYSVFWAFLETQIVSQCVKIVFLQNFGNVKNEVFEKKIAFFVFDFFFVGDRETEKAKKKKREKAKKPYKNRFFLRWSSKHMKNQKKRIFLPKLPDTICVRKGEKKRAFSCTLSVLAKIFFWTKTV